jgi:hypothetical protein
MPPNGLRMRQRLRSLWSRFLWRLSGGILLSCVVIALIYGMQLNRFLFPKPTLITQTYTFDSDGSSPFDSQLTDSATFATTQGQFAITTTRPGQIELALAPVADHAVRTTAVKVNAIAGPESEAGIIFLWTDARNYYFYSTSNDGFFTVTWIHDGTRLLITHQLNENVQQAGGTNRLRVVAEQAMIRFYLDDAFVYELYNGEQDLGSTGIGAAGAYIRSTTMVFDDFVQEYQP